MFFKKLIGTLTVLAAAAPIYAQSYVPAIVTSAQTTLLSGATSAAPGQVGIDKAGNVYYVDHNSPYSLKEIPAGTNTPVSLITGVGQYNSDGVFVDPKGNLWVANGNGTASISGSTAYIGLLEIPASATTGLPNVASVATATAVASLPGGACTATSTTACYWASNTFAVNVTSYYSQPSAVTVDANGTVYFPDYNSKKIVSFNIATPTAGTLLATAPTANNQASVAVDGAGSVYYCDDASTNYGAGGTGKLSLLSGYTAGTTTGGTLTTVGTTATLTSALITSCIGVANDQYGNLFVHGTSTSATAQISEVPFEGTALNFADEFGIITNVTNGTATGLVTAPAYAGNIDSNGNFFYTTSAGIYELQINGYNYGNTTIGNTTASPALNLYVNTAPTSSISSYFPTGSPVTNTTAAYLQSFPWAGTKSFTGGTSYSQGANYSIVMNFQPIHPGLLKGSFTPRANGNDAAIVNLQGNGVGPQPLFFPGTPSLVFTKTTATTPVTLNAPQGLAIDSYGDIFVADTANSKVVADCLASTTQNEDGTGGNTSNSFCSLSTYTAAINQLGTGFTSPVAIALDGAQGLYVLDSASAGTPLTYINGQSLASTNIIANGTKFGGTALSSPSGLAVDGYVNAYIADTGNNRIVKAHTYGAVGTQNAVYVPATTKFGTLALSGPTGLAVDQSQNLYIADTGNNRIVEYSQNGVASVISTTGVTLSAPRAVAIYPGGQLVITDANGIYLVSGGTATTLSFGTSYVTTGAKGVALDPFGNIFLSNTANNQVLQLNVSTGQTITFPTTGAGSSSSTVAGTVVNSGTTSLVNTALTISSGYTADAANTCTATSTTVAGSSCTLGIKFTPLSSASGTVTGTASLTNNQLGYTLNTATSNETATFATNGSQTLNLTGSATSLKTAQTINFTTLTTPVTYGATTTETLAATATSGLTVTFSVLSGPGTISGNTLTITGAGSIVVAADQAGNTTYAAAPEVTQTVVVNQASQTINFTALATPVQYTTTAITLSATGGASGNSVVFSIISGPGTVSGNQLTITGIGTVVVAANQAGTTNYAAATQVTQSVVVTQASQTITFTQPAAVTYPTTVALSASSTSGLTVTFKVISGPGTISGTTLTPTGIGTVVVEADQAGNTNYAAATAVQKSVVISAISTLAAPQFLTATTNGTPVVAGTYNISHPPTVFLVDTLPAGAAIYYTLDGSTPTASSNLYSSQVANTGITINQTETLQAVAILLGYTNSPVTSAAYTIDTAAEALTYTINPNSLTLQKGASGTINITVTPVNGINAPLSFACSGLPTGASCAFNPTAVSTTPAQTPVSTVLTVTAPTTISQNLERGRTLLPGVTFALAFCLLGFRKRRRFQTALMLVIAMAGFTLLSGCGSSSSGNQVSTVTVSLGGDSVRYSSTFTLTVTQ